MLLFYVRHGDPIYNPDSLTPLGLRQAEAVAKRLSRYGLNEIYTSSSNRAILTSKPTCEILKKEATILDWCNEDYAWNEFVVDFDGGRTWLFSHDETAKKLVSNEIFALGENWAEHSMFDGKNVRSGIERVRRETYGFLAGQGYVFNPEKNMYKCENHNEKRIALFAHQGFGLVFLSTVLRIPYPIFSTHFDMSHTGVTVIEFDDNDGYCIPKILQLSNDSHLYAEGLPTKYHNSIYF